MRKYLLVLALAGCSGERPAAVVSVPAPVARALDTGRVDNLTGVLEVTDGDEVVYRSDEVRGDASGLEFPFVGIPAGEHTFWVHLRADLLDTIDGTLGRTNVPLVDHFEVVDVRPGTGKVIRAAGEWKLPAAGADVDEDGLSTYGELVLGHDPLRRLTEVPLSVAGLRDVAGSSSGFAVLLDDWIARIGWRQCLEQPWNVQIECEVAPEDPAQSIPDACPGVAMRRLAASSTRAVGAGDDGCLLVRCAESDGCVGYRTQTSSGGVPLSATWNDVALDENGTTVALASSAGLFVASPNWSAGSSGIDLGSPVPGVYTQVASLPGCALPGSFLALRDDAVIVARLDSSGTLETWSASMDPLPGAFALEVVSWPADELCYVEVASGSPAATRIDQFSISATGNQRLGIHELLISPQSVATPGEGITGLMALKSSSYGREFSLWAIAGGNLYETTDPGPDSQWRSEPPLPADVGPIRGFATDAATGLPYRPQSFVVITDSRAFETP